MIFSTQNRIKLAEEQNKRQNGTQAVLKKFWKKKCSHQRNIKKKKSFLLQKCLLFIKVNIVNEKETKL